MLIKNLSRKGKNSSTVKQLLKYILKENKKSDFVYTHNLQGSSIAEFTKEFMDNEKNRIHVRSNNVLIYQDIIAFHYKDSEIINQNLVEAIIKEYIRLRNPNALYVASLHTSTRHIHIHLAISGIDQVGKSIRVTKDRLKEIKISLQNKFPNLKYSIVDHGKNEKQKIFEREYQMKKRHAKTEKESLTEILELLYKKSNSKEDFYKRIQDSKLKIYERNGKSCGIITNRKYRFKTVGFDENKLNVLDLQKEFESLRSSRNNQNEIERNLR